VAMVRVCLGAAFGIIWSAFPVPAWSQSASVSITTMVIESSGSCVDVNGGSSQVGLGIDQWTCAGTSSQSFRFTPTSDGYFTIQPQNDSLCLDAGSGSVTTGIQVLQNNCSGGSSQKWHVVANSDGSYAVSTYSGAGCLDVYAGRTANGTIVTTYACHGSTNESFMMAGFHPASGPPLSRFVSTMMIQSSSSCVDVNGAS
jgi:hypothetical protein